MNHFVVLTFFFIFAPFSHADKVNFYEKVITEQVRSSTNYEYRTSASQFEPCQNVTTDFGEFDFIIVGGGSTGSVLASRLSEVEDWKVLLLEAGGVTNDSTAIPALWSYVVLSDYNWGFKSVPQKDACLDMVDQRCDYARGQGLGGSSLINMVAYTRGNRRDFDQWKSLGNPGWGFDDVLPYLKKAENFRKTNPDLKVDLAYHGTGGPLTVEEFTPLDALTNAWLKANKERGYEIVDYNGGKQTGGGVFQKTTDHGRRADLGTSYIQPEQNRQNLKILTGAYVTKVITKGQKATGVKFAYRGKYYIARSKKEVILSAGAFNSPQILMLSGIGPSEHLTKFGIKTVANLEVGSHLKEHPFFYGVTFNSSFRGANESLKHFIRQYLKGEGPLAFSIFTSGVGFYNSKSSTIDYPDVELLLIYREYISNLLKQKPGSPREKTWQNLTQGQFSVLLIGLHPKSTGTVRLKSNNPFDYPLIDPALLSDAGHNDIDTLYKALNLALSLVDTNAFAQFNPTLLKQETPACKEKKYLSKDYWYCLFRQFTITGYHPVGTCRMGPNPAKGDVVDATNKVHGIDGLRVADASIFPAVISGHTNAACVMVGEKVADQLKREYSNL